MERPTFNPTNLDGTEQTISSALTFTMALNTSVTTGISPKKSFMFVFVGVFFSNIIRFSFSHTVSALYWTLWVLLSSNHAARTLILPYRFGLYAFPISFVFIG